MPSAYPMTPLRGPPILLSSPPPSPVVAQDAESTSATKNANATKLKGKIWPGMHLFDAATPDEARRRNQKKDVSVVKKMERLTRLIVPEEVTYSSEWSVKKSRHIDDLDDASSLIEGESPLKIKPKVKPRARKRTTRGVGGTITKTFEVRGKGKISPKAQRKGVARARNGNDASPAEPAQIDPYLGQYRPAEEQEQLDLANENQSPNNRPSSFTMFEDSPIASRQANKSTGAQNALSMQSDNGPAPRLSYNTASWLQPQNQNPLFLDKHSYQRKPSFQQTLLQGLGVGKENMRPLLERDSQHLNPLPWNGGSDSHDDVFGYGSSHVHGSDLLGQFGLSDPFLTGRNPLAMPLTFDGADFFNHAGRLSSANHPSGNALHTADDKRLPRI
jgi:hypothetical protein